MKLEWQFEYRGGLVLGWFWRWLQMTLNSIKGMPVFKLSQNKALN